MIGLATDASAGAAAFGLMWTGWVALLGAAAAMVLVYVGTGQGFTSPARMLIVGIGVDAMALATVQWIITRSSRRTVLAVLHDLNQAARYATHLVCMKDGRTLAPGPPAEIMTAELVGATFGIHCHILAAPDGGGPAGGPHPGAGRLGRVSVPN